MRYLLSYPLEYLLNEINDYVYLNCIFTNVDEFGTLNFVQEILLSNSCDVESDNLTTGKTLSLPQMTSCCINTVDLFDSSLTGKITPISNNVT